METLHLKLPIKIDDTADNDGYIITDATNTEFFFYRTEDGQLEYDGFCTIPPGVDEEIFNLKFPTDHPPQIDL